MEAKSPGNDEIRRSHDKWFREKLKKVLQRYPERKHEFSNTSFRDVPRLSTPARNYQ